MPHIDYLQDWTHRFSSLMRDPQSGHISWMMCYGDLMNELNQYWNYSTQSRDIREQVRARVRRFDSTAFQDDHCGPHSDDTGPQGSQS